MAILTQAQAAAKYTMTPERQIAHFQSQIWIEENGFKNRDERRRSRALVDAYKAKIEELKERA